MFRLLLFMLLMALCPLTVQAATYYVDGALPDHACTAEAPALSRNTITKGMGCLSGGDTLIVKNGVYPEFLNGATLPNGSPGAPTIVRAANVRQAIVRPTAGCCTSHQFPAKAWVTIEGLVFDGINTGIASAGLKIQDGQDHVLFKDVEVTNIRGDNENPSPGPNWQTTAAVGTGANTLLTLRRLLIHDIGANQFKGGSCNECYGYGIYMSGTNTVLEQSELFNIAGWAVHGYTSGTGGASNNIIRANYIHDTGGPILMCQQNNQIVNNVIVRAGTVGNRIGPGLQLNTFCAGQRGANNTVLNNTIVGATGPCMDLGGSSNGIIRNNICYGNGSDTIVGGGAGNVKDHNLLGVNPQFVNAGAGDYHLQSGSPAIDAGNTASCASADLDGVARQGRCDIGAYAFVAAPGPSPAPVPVPVPVPPSGPVTLYVSPGGYGDTPSDAYTCVQAQTITTPKATVAAGMRCLSVPGSTLLLRGGVYSQGMISTKYVGPGFAGGTGWGKPTTIRAYQNETVTLRATSPGFGVLFFNAGPTIDRYIILDKLILDANGLAESALIAEGGAHHLRFQRGTLRNSIYSPGYLDGVQNIEIFGSLIERQNTYPPIALVGNTSGTLVDDNTIVIAPTMMRVDP
jgi:parallel beta-helix repeat protein